jgi:GTP pyrophosphokinase
MEVAYIARLEKLREEILSHHPQSSLEVVDKAFLFASEAHKRQTRLSGDPYIIHPINVAGTLAKMRMDPYTVAAGLLHDVLEDTSVTFQNLVEEFGEDIAFMVEGVSKIGRVESRTMLQQQAETIRKMLLAMAKDIRVILIKLADRLHNIRTLRYISKEQKRKRIAQETLDIYVPLAHRLGIAWLKWEMEDLAFREINPEMYANIKDRVAQKKEEREAYINDMICIVKEKLSSRGIKAEVTGRPKSFYSIYNKMLEQNLDFDDLYDLIALRIITGTVDECYVILGIIHSSWHYIPGRFKDYITIPKPNMYQSLHTTVIGPKGERVEFQIRTWDMHRVAEEGIAAHWRYKEGRTDSEEDQWVRWIRNLLEWQQEVGDSREFLQNLKVDLFPEKVYVFTPKGEVKSLPRGATPLDLAYAVHTEVGHHCTGAKVDGRLVPLTYQLKTGEQVQIITSQERHPSRDWLRMVKTTRARAKINTWIRSQERIKAFELGKDMSQREFKKFRKNFAKQLENGELDQVARDLGFNSSQDMVVAVGFGKISPRQVLKKTISPDDLEQQEKKLEEAKPPKRKRKEVGVVVKGLDDVLVRFARCCNPIPGDEIIGYITRGKGITIHTADCPNLLHLQIDPARRVDASWALDGGSVVPVKLKIETEDKPGLLAEISGAIAKEGVNVEKAQVTTSIDKKARLNFIIDVKDVEQLERVKRSIRRIPGVVWADRVMR